MSELITFSHVNFGYNSKELLLKNSSFSIHSDDFVTIIGPNGSGKTTLLKLIMGLEKPLSGSVLIKGKTPDKMRSKLGHVPQSILYDPLFPASVLDVVLMGALGKSRFKFFYSSSDYKSAKEALSRVEMIDFSNHSFAKLSGGQKQRVLIARALLSNPEILILDEPTASIDALIESRLYTLLKELSKTMAIIMVSHDHHFAADIVNKVVCLDHGRLAIHCTKPLNPEEAKKMDTSNVSLIMHHYCRHENEGDGNAK